MTEPSAETLEKEADKLWLTDAELIRRLGLPRDTARDAIRMLDAQRRSGFPPKVQMWGGRRYWPAVKAYFDALYGTKVDAPKLRAVK